LQDGAGYAEIIRSSPYELRELIGKPGYNKKLIEEVIKRNGDNSENDADVNASPGKRALNERKQTINRYEFYMRAPRVLVDEYEKLARSRHDTDTINLASFDDLEDSGDDVEIMGDIADKEIIRLIRPGEESRPHHMWVVESNLDESTGSGIPDNMEDVQGSLVGMIRAFEDNKKLSANVTSAVKARFFTDASQLDDIVPGKKYDISDECDDVRKAIMPIIFPDVGESLISGINLMMQFKDDVSMIPTILQGFTLPKHKPDTAFEVNELTKNSGKYVGQAIRNDDEQFIEPEIRDIYEYNMIYGEDEECKVNARVTPNGFTSFQNKEIRGARMQQALSMMISSEFLQPYCKIKPHLDVLYEAFDEDPDKFINSEDEMADTAEQSAQAEEEEIAKQLELKQADAEIEAGAKIQENEATHANDMVKSEAEHVQDMELAEAEAKLDFAYDRQPRAQGGQE